MVNENKQKTNRSTEELSASELKKLKNVVLGYGNMTNAAEIAGVHRRTLERICHTGKGLATNISAIREKILSPAKAAVLVLLFLSLSSCVLTGKRMFTDEGRPMPGGKTIRQGMNPQSHIVPSRIRHYRPINSIK